MLCNKQCTIHRVIKIWKRAHLALKRNYSTTNLKTTPLHEFHLDCSAKMIDFFGFHMPLSYTSQNITDSHLFVRESCGIFDVSHMLQVKAYGPQSAHFFESLTVADISGMHGGCGTLSVYTNGNGGIMDDLIINKCDESNLYIVSNAACSSKIVKYLNESCLKQGDIKFEVISNALMALQGPKSYSVLRQGIAPSDMSKFENLYFMETTLLTSLFGFKNNDEGIRLTRCGYTGEDGYEISMHPSVAISIAKALMDNKSVKPIGLAARDTLRLEAGLCLYGNDLTEETTPVEASLSWLIAKRRRLPDTEPRFPGYSIIMKQLKNPNMLTRKRIGLQSEFGPPARHGAKIFDESGQNEIGIITSGCRSPSLNKNIAMAYVKPEYTKRNTPLNVSIRNKLYPFMVTPMPFVPTHYVRRPTQ